MDEVEIAIVAVADHVPSEQAEEWFDVLCGSYDDFGENWSMLKDTLATRAYERGFGTEVVETFVLVMENDISDQLGVLRQVVDRRDELPRAYEQLVQELREALAGQDQGEVTPWTSGETAGWYDYLTKQKNWYGWSGREEDWDEFCQWFLQYAAEHQAHPQATLFLNEVANDSRGKLAALADLGIVIGGEEATQGQTSAWGEHTAAWYDALTGDMGWAWTGVPEHWRAFREQFLQAAEGRQAGEYAEAFLAEVESASDPAGLFADYGIAFAPPAPEAVDETPAETAQRIETEVATAVLGSRADLADELGGPEQLEALVTEVLRERVAAAA